MVGILKCEAVEWASDLGRMGEGAIEEWKTGRF